MKILLTGGAGFIGNRLAVALSREGYKITIADDLRDQKQIRALSQLEIIDWISPSDLCLLGSDDSFFLTFDAIVHQGAITSTTYPTFDGVYKNNFRLSQTLARAAYKNKIPFIYASSASVYGSEGKRIASKNQQLNFYAFSKYLFDSWITNLEDSPNFLGLRYFNVYGPGEEGKGDMASVALHAFNQIKSTGKVRLFGESAGCAAGEHLRDFVYVDDICDIVLWALRTKWNSSIVDVGTGCPKSFNELVSCVFDALGMDSNIDYIPMPEYLENQYQSFSQADTSDLVKIGYQKPLTPLSEGILRYMQELSQGE